MLCPPIDSRKSLTSRSENLGSRFSITQKDSFESFPAEHRVMQPRQPVHYKHPESGRECRDQDGKFEHDREEGGHRKEVRRLAHDNQGVDERAGNKLEGHGGDESRKAAKEDDLSEQGTLQTHGLIHPMNGKRREDVKPPEPGVPHLLRRMEKVARGVELGGHAVERRFVIFRRVHCVI